MLYYIMFFPPSRMGPDSDDRLAAAQGRLQRLSNAGSQTKLEAQAIPERDYHRELPRVHDSVAQQEMLADGLESFAGSHASNLPSCRRALQQYRYDQRDLLAMQSRSVRFVRDRQRTAEIADDRETTRSILRSTYPNSHDQSGRRADRKLSTILVGACRFLIPSC